MIDDSDLFLTIPAAATDATPATTIIMCHHRGLTVPGVELLVLFQNKIWAHAITDEKGEAPLNLYSAHLPMTVFAAAPGFGAHFEYDPMPTQKERIIEMQSLPNGWRLGILSGGDRRSCRACRGI